MKRRYARASALLLCFVAVIARGQRVVTERGRVIIEYSYEAAEEETERMPDRVEIYAKTNYDGMPMPWDEAVKYCAQLAHNGGGWRLPTRDELKLAVLLRPALAALSEKVFTQLELKFYWSETQESEENSWYVPFNYADEGYDHKSNFHHVRCVRTVKSKKK